MKERNSFDFIKSVYLVLGILAAISLIGYGLTYLIRMPKVDPANFIPQEPGINNNTYSIRVVFQSGFILLYAFSFLPVTVLFSIKKYHINPYAIVLAGCLAGISFLIEIFNNLPVVAFGLVPGKLSSVPPEVMLYLKQIDTIKYLSFDVPGFSLAYTAIFIYAMIYLPNHRGFSYLVFGSIFLFLANIPCLWIAPNAAIPLMVFSIFTLAPVPVFLSRKAVE